MTEVVVATKRCTKCGEEKAFSEFHKCSKAKDGYQFYCKECRRPTRYLLPGEYQAIVEAQGGTCAICGIDPRGNTHRSIRYQRLQVDYAEEDHGTVRGLVCAYCHHNISLWDNNPEGLLKLYDHIMQSSRREADFTIRDVKWLVYEEKY